jgi:hypothetical protein
LLLQNQTLFSIAGVCVTRHQNDIFPKRTKSIYRPDACLHPSTRQLPGKVKFPQPDFMTMAEDILAISRIFGQSFEKLKQLMFWDNEENIGKTTVVSWGHENRRRAVIDGKPFSGMVMRQ